MAAAENAPMEVEQRGKSLFQGNPFANHKSPLLLRVLMKKLRREGGLKDGLEDGARPGEAFLAGEAALDHGKASGAANALTFHTFGSDEKKDEDN